MTIGIISDTHDHLENIEKVLSWFKEHNIDTILHCGDVCAPSVLIKGLVENFTGTIHHVFGNVDGDRFLMLKLLEESGRKNVFLHGEFADFEIGKIKVAMTHYPQIAENLAKSKKYDLVCYGHNHKQALQSIGNTTLVNPGSLGGLFAPATFATYDTAAEKVSLYRVKDIS